MLEGLPPRWRPGPANLCERPHRQHHDDLYQAALEYVNAVRTALDLPTLDELPKGLPGWAGECSIARALTGPATVATVGLSLLTVEPKPGHQRRLYAPMPGVVARFIRLFDAEEYPELLDYATL